MNRPPRLDPGAFLRSRSALLGILSALTLQACGTQEISGDHTVVSYTPTDPSEGGLLIILASTAETYDQLLAESHANKNDTAYHVLVDGKPLMVDDTRSLQPLVVARGGAYGAGFHPAGAHHFTLVTPDGRTAIETDGVIASGALTRFYLFGPAEALQTRFLANPFAPPAGDVHVSAINLVRSGGVRIEIVSCMDAATCAPVSPALALGDTFDADLPARATSLDGASSFSPTGAGYGYRQVATASLPTPPILSLWPGEPFISPAPGAPPFTLVAAPIYMASDGTFLAGTD